MGQVHKEMKKGAPRFNISSDRIIFTNACVICIMYSFFLISFVIAILTFAPSLSFPTAGSNFDLLETEPSLSFSTIDLGTDWLKPESSLMADAALSNPCVAPQNDLTSSNEETNLFSRQNDQCLPPVKIGAEASQIFEAPLDLLESALLPPTFLIPNLLSPKEETPDNPFYDGRLPNGVEGELDLDELEEQGWQPYTGPVHIDKSENCAKLVGAAGNYNYEVCCDHTVRQLDPITDLARRILAGVDERTLANNDYLVVAHCERTCPLFFPGGFFSFPFSIELLDANGAVALPNVPCTRPYSYRLCCAVYVS